MVSNAEIKEALNRKRIEYKKRNLGYLVCSKCNGYYQLQKNENPEDFDKCQCGGLLDYYKYVDKVEENISDVEKETKKLLYNNETDNPNVREKWDKLWQQRLAQINKEKIYCSKKDEKKSIPWDVVGGISTILILYLFIGVFGFLLGIVLFMLYKEFD